jgi:hypothetical protein
MGDFVLGKMLRLFLVLKDCHIQYRYLVLYGMLVLLWHVWRTSFGHQALQFIEFLFHFGNLFGLPCSRSTYILEFGFIWVLICNVWYSGIYELRYLTPFMLSSRKNKTLFPLTLHIRMVEKSVFAPLAWGWPVIKECMVVLCSVAVISWFSPPWMTWPGFSILEVNNHEHP